MSKDTYKGKSWFDEEKTGRVDDKGDLYEGKTWFDEEKVGRVDDKGNVYRGTSWLEEEKVGRIDKNGIIHKGGSWLTEERTGRIDDDGNIHEGSSWFSEEKVGRSKSRKGGGALLTSDNDSSSDTSSTRISTSGGGGGMSGDMHWSIWLAMLPALVLLGITMFLYEKLLGESFESSRFGRVVLAPVDAASENFFAAYAIVSVIWFVALSIDPENSYLLIAFYSLFNPVIAGFFIVAVGILFPLVALVEWFMGEFSEFWNDSAYMLLVSLFFIPYYLAGAMLIPFGRKTRNGIGMTCVAGIITFALIAPTPGKETNDSPAPSRASTQYETATVSHPPRQVTSSGKHHVIIKSTKSLAEAKETRSWLIRKGYPSQVIQSKNGWYAVSLGGYSKPEAKQILSSSKRKGDAPKDAFIMPPKRIQNIVSSD